VLIFELTSRLKDQQYKMKQFQLIFLTIILFQFSCKPNKKQAEKQIEDLKPFPVVLKPFGICKITYSYDEENPTWISNSNYSYYYIGDVKDTVYLSPFIPFTPLPPLPPINSAKKTNEMIIPKLENQFKKYYIKWKDKKRNYKNRVKAKIDVQINTSIIISNSYPIMLTNLDIDTIFIGSDIDIPLIMEAMDSLGKWKPIQTHDYGCCGVGVGSIILPPNESVITLAPIFKGNYKTKLRLKIRNNYSKPFIGFINYRQFQSKFDENGEYKEEYIRENGDN
jgi:hypothetical protein